MILWLILFIVSLLGTVIYIVSTIGNGLQGNSWIPRAFITAVLFFLTLVFADALNWVTVF